MEIPVPAPTKGVLREWLVSEGASVAAGQALAIIEKRQVEKEA